MPIIITFKLSGKAELLVELFKKKQSIEHENFKA